LAPELHGDRYKASCIFAAFESLFTFNFGVTSLSTTKIYSVIYKH